MLTTPLLKQHALRDPSAALPGVATVSVCTTIVSKTTNPSAAIAPDKYSLSNQKHIMNEKDLMSILATVLADKFGYKRQHRFKEQFKEFLPRLGAENKRTFAMLTKEKLWFHNTIHIAYSCVTLPVFYLLVQIAEYTEMVLRRSKYLMLSVQYQSLARYVLKGTNHPSIHDACGSDLSMVLAHQNYPNDILLGFKIPKFDGDTLKGDIFLKKIHDTFKSADQALY